METKHESEWEVPGVGSDQCRLTLKTYGNSDRFIAVAKLLAIFWGSAIVALFIPVLHFILVPALVLLGLGLGLRAALLNAALTKAEGDCPACGQPVTPKMGKARPNFPLWTFCPDCDARLRIRRPESLG